MHKIDAVHHRIGYKLIILLLKILKKIKKELPYATIARDQRNQTPKYLFYCLYVCLYVCLDASFHLFKLSHSNCLVRHLDPKVCLLVVCACMCVSRCRLHHSLPSPFFSLFLSFLCNCFIFDTCLSFSRPIRVKIISPFVTTCATHHC